MTGRIRIRSPFVRHTPLTYRTRNFPPPAPLPGNSKHRGYFPGCFPPFTGITYYRVRAHLASLIVMSCIVMPMFALYLFFFPLFSPVDYETDAAAAQFDYGVDDPSLLPEQPGKKTPLSILTSLISFPLMLALELLLLYV